MNLIISGLCDACEYVPKDRTYAIRLESPKYPFDGESYNLTKSGLWVVVHTYSFDDRNPSFGEGKLFKRDIAQKIISDFEEKFLETDSLLVHCTLGRNRSPAVGIALNNLFNLGNNSEDLMEEFPDFNKYVYGTLMSVGRKK
ncbi:hypothetical protein J4474_02240 [Candidatus Pacearchaeota archaeon]|nr:hypothetical protein [Candidatus Pacearchaeota archaeon]